MSIADGHGGTEAVDFANTQLHENFNVVKAKDAGILRAYQRLISGTDAGSSDLKTIETEAAFRDPISHAQRLRLAFLKT